LDVNREQLNYSSINPLKTMKKLLLFLAFISVVSFANAQCTNIVYTSTGLHPDTLRHGYATFLYGDTLTLIVPADTTTSGVTITIDSVSLTSITGLPAGFTYTPNAHHWAGASAGCAIIAGTPTHAEAIAQGGIYPIAFNCKLYGKYSGMPISYPFSYKTDTLKIINNNLLGVSITQANITCNGGHNGTATATAAGGTAPYTYLWSNAEAMPAITGLTAGTYTITVTDSLGTTATASVIITQPAKILINNPKTICDGSSYTINGHVYMIQGNYFDTLTSVHGCDSIIKTQLTVTPLPPTPVITKNDTILTSNAASGNQWYKNNTKITGATAQTDTIKSNGSYFVIVTVNGCSSDTSNIITITNSGIDELSFYNNIKIHPNPVADILTIETPQPAVIEIINIEGQLIKTLSANGNKTNIDVSAFQSGVYFIKIQTEDGIAFKKVVKE